MKALVFGLCSIFMLSQIAYGQSSEFLFQAEEKQHTLTLSLNTTSIKIGNAPGMGQADYAILDYEYGFSQNFSTYLSLSYVDATLFQSMYGMGPTQFGVKYLLPDLGPGALYGRVNVSVAMIDGSEIGCGGTHCNVNDGSVGVDLNLAYQWSLKNAYTGLSLRYGLFSTDGKVQGGSDYEKDGFLTITAFYERHITETNLWGTSIGYVGKGGFAGGAYMPPIVMGSFVTDDILSELDVSSLAFRGYLKTKVSEAFESIIDVGLTKVIDGNDIISTKTRFLNFNFALRKRF